MSKRQKEMYNCKKLSTRCRAFRLQRNGKSTRLTAGMLSHSCRNVTRIKMVCIAHNVKTGHCKKTHKSSYVLWMLGHKGMFRYMKENTE